MHVLGRGFSQRRKTPKPRDLHIRKVSFSGCSLSSGSSFSSSPSTSVASSSSSLSPPSTASTARAPSSSRSPAAGFVDPLASHPTFTPPPRLCDRPLLTSPERQRFDEPTTFFLEEDETPVFDDDDTPAAAPAKRPALPRSRWSDSTVATVESIMSHADSDMDDAEEHDEASTTWDDSDSASATDSDSDSDDGDDDIDWHYYLQQPPDGHQSMPNFSYKRETVAKRPPIKTLDSLEDFIKRGGWKRRGIVFHNGDTDDGNSDVIDMSF
ncbi:hypothetical protein CDD83_2081 [Cordyceps sp. RAO-2017]|nr:hypothetical protein CDD83_2081 [Cordyceps sp. RAO-2017]